jgi:adenylate kinase family enzyme
MIATPDKEITRLLMKFLFFCVLIIIVLIILFEGFIAINCNPKNARPLYIVLLGTPESSKEAMGMLLSKKYKIPYLSVKNILNKSLNQDNKTEDQLITNDLLIKKIIIERLKSNDSRNGLILDGYPGTLNQAKNLYEFIYTNLPTTVRQHAFTIIISLIRVQDSGVVKTGDNKVAAKQQLKSHNGFVLDERDDELFSSTLVDPITKHYRLHRALILINSNKFVPQTYNGLFKIIDNKLSLMLWK